MKTIYFVKYGPDASHQVEAKLFHKLKEARLFASNLPKTPIGGERPFSIERHRYVESHIFGDIVQISEVKA